MYYEKPNNIINFGKSFVRNPLLYISIAAMTLGSCNSDKNQKYEDFATFVQENNEYRNKNNYQLDFLKDGKKYTCYKLGEDIVINIREGKSSEYFQDNNLNGLNYYKWDYNITNIKTNHLFQSKENKQKFDSLVVSIPKYYEQQNKK